MNIKNQILSAFTTLICFCNQNSKTLTNEKTEVKNEFWKIAYGNYYLTLFNGLNKKTLT